MISLSWGQVNAWRLSLQALSHRLQPGKLVQAARQTLGIYAQLMLAAAMAISARVARFYSILMNLRERIMS